MEQKRILFSMCIFRDLYDNFKDEYKHLESVRQKQSKLETFNLPEIDVDMSYEEMMDEKTVFSTTEVKGCEKNELFKMPECYQESSIDFTQKSDVYFNSIEDYDSFLYNDYALKIFGNSDLIETEHINVFNSILNTGVICHKEKGHAPSATMLLLSKSKLKPKNIHFTSNDFNYTNVLENYDYILYRNIENIIVLRNLKSGQENKLTKLTEIKEYL